MLGVIFIDKHFPFQFVDVVLFLFFELIYVAWLEKNEIEPSFDISEEILWEGFVC
jgi:hypothetical protein